MVSYLSAADYYATSPGELHGKGFEHLDISGKSARDVFECLAHNVDPKTGELLRPLAREGERVGMDFTFSATKSVSIAREMAGPGNEGDTRIEAAHREAVAYAMSLIEADIQTRVRGGRDGDRVTGNLLGYRVTHRDTRINPQDQMPDPNLHDHFFVLNATFDEIEGKWKAAQVADIKHDAPYYEALYHSRLASNLKELGYGIRREGKAFEIEGIDRGLIEKFSRRTKYIEEVAGKLGITKPESKAKLGATTRLGKAKELANDLNGYYVSRLTQEEKQQLGDLKGQPSYESSEQEAVAFAIGHMFERSSVVDEKRLYEEAIRHGIGSVTPDGVKAEALRQGVLVLNGEATTRDVLAEEQRVIAFAREGRGTCAPMGLQVGLPHVTDLVGRTLQGAAAASADTGTLSPEPQAVSPRSNDRTIDQFARARVGGPLNQTENTHAGTSRDPQAASLRSKNDHVPSSWSKTDEKWTHPAGLSAEQAAIASHVWNSTDRVILIRGAAGTGKTHTMRTTIEGMDRQVVVLAPSADASRGVLRAEGFKKADTVARFLLDRDFQKKAQNGVIWVDEAGLLGIRQVRQVFDIAEKMNARVVLQGDRRQHGSVERGASLRVLEEYAGLPVAELKDIRRQRGQYKAAVESLSKGDVLAGYDKLNELGWIEQTGDKTALVDDYIAGLKAGKSVLVVAPTHAEGDGITTDIRARLKEMGVVAGEDHHIPHLVPQNWTEAEKGDLAHRSDGAEVLVFHRNSGTFKAGQQVRVADIHEGDRITSPAHFSVYRLADLPIAAGDTLRITANGMTKGKTHKLNNGSMYEVKGFDKDGDIVLENGWVVKKDWGHVAHGYVSTSHASQGKTVDRVLIAMGSESVPATSAEQFYVSVSRGKESARIYTDLPPDKLREAVLRTDTRKSATELVGRKPKRTRREKLWGYMRKAQDRFTRLRDGLFGGSRERNNQERHHDGHGR